MLFNSRRCSRQIRGSAHVRALIAAGAIAIAAASSTACVSALRYQQLQQERNTLAADNEKLKGEVADVNRSGEELAKERAMLEQEKNALAAEKTALEENLDHMRTQESTLGAKVNEQDEEARKMQATYDGLVKDLKKELKAGQVEIQQLRDGLRVNVSQDILFDSGSAELDRSGTQVLSKVAMQLKKSRHQILVIGHTDNKTIRPALAKQYPSNWELAGARAASVVRLFAQSGLPSKRMRAVSVADVQPVASNKTEEGRAKNRRIEIRLRPVPTEG
jgi:chemotaxis protein MotB